ncbi:tailspike [Escherichia phage vB_EcoP_PAS7]|uniref:Tailspike n=1 Tax=Escherichia phage vB_EcoP_PAS7 TaxID=3053875 RepID=A0AA51Z026_9CAUD|nr:tailspike [Escherichia phage vB_EcoP_PAS7]
MSLVSLVRDTTQDIKHKADILLDYLDRQEQGLGQVQEFVESSTILNIPSLRSLLPSSEGQVVQVLSSYSTAATQLHLGGGQFQAVNNLQAEPDDGGIVVHSTHPTLVWKRINFTAYDMQFWGVVADASTDNAAAITRATQYARRNRIVLEAPAGSIHTSEMVPLYDNMGIRGHGRAENTVFYKTTNNGFNYTKNGVTVLTVDALAGFVPKEWDLADYEIKSFCVHAQLIGCMFRRLGLSAENVATTRPQYGLHIGKAATAVVRQCTFEGGYIGIKGYNVFSSVFESVAAVQFNGYGYAGVSISDYRNSTLYNSGTSLDMRIVQVRGYQFGFELDRLQYSTLIDCTAEEIVPMAGETTSYAFSMYDPFCITMLNCATEFVKGGQIRVLGFANPSFRPQLKVTGFIAIDQQNPAALTPIYLVDNGGTTGMNVVIEASELSRNTALSNNGQPSVQGAGAKVILIGCSGEDWVASGSGVFTRLA